MKYPGSASIPILLCLGYQTVKVFSYILHEALTEIYGVGIVLKLNFMDYSLCFPESFQRTSCMHIYC